MIEVLNKHHFKGKPLPAGSHQICRPSPLGNPWTHIPSKLPEYMRYATYVPTRDEAIARYRTWFLAKIKSETPNPVKAAFEKLVEEYRKTGELKLVCYCRERQGKGNKVIPCHGDVIAAAVLALADGPSRQTEPA